MAEEVLRPDISIIMTKEEAMSRVDMLILEGTNAYNLPFEDLADLLTAIMLDDEPDTDLDRERTMWLSNGLNDQLNRRIYEGKLRHR